MRLLKRVADRAFGDHGTSVESQLLKLYEHLLKLYEHLEKELKKRDQEVEKLRARDATLKKQAEANAAKAQA